MSDATNPIEMIFKSGHSIFFINFAKELLKNYIMLKEIDNVVFDLGGVVLDIDRDACVRNLEAIGLPNASSLLDLYRQQGIFLALEQGEITAARFYDTLRKDSMNPGLTDTMLEEALCKFIIGLPVERLQAIRKIRQSGKSTFVLSNTNAIMYNSVIDSLFRQEGLAIGDYFDGIIASFAEKVCKPDPGIFRILLERYSLDPSRTLFIDDSEVNVNAAEKLNIKGHFLPKNTDFIESLHLKES